MHLSFDLNNHCVLTVDVDGEELDIDGGGKLFIDGVGGVSILGQLEAQYRNVGIDDVAAALMIAIQLRIAPPSEMTAKVVVDLMALIANKMLLDSDLPMFPDTRNCLEKIKSTCSEFDATGVA